MNGTIKHTIAGHTVVFWKDRGEAVKVANRLALEFDEPFEATRIDGYPGWLIKGRVSDEWHEFPGEDRFKSCLPPYVQATLEEL